MFKVNNKDTKTTTLAIFTGKHLCCSLFLIKLQAIRLASFLKVTPIQVFTCEHSTLFYNTYFEKHLRTTAASSNCITNVEYMNKDQRDFSTQ